MKLSKNNVFLIFSILYTLTIYLTSGLMRDVVNFIKELFGDHFSSFINVSVILSGLSFCFLFRNKILDISKLKKLI